MWKTEGKHIGNVSFLPSHRKSSQKCCEQRGQVICELVMYATPISHAESPSQTMAERVPAMGSAESLCQTVMEWVPAMGSLSHLPALRYHLPWLGTHTSLLHAVMSPDWEFIMLGDPSGDSGLYHLI